MLVTPPLVAEGDNVLDCYLANVGKVARKVRIEAVTKEGKTVQAGTPTLRPGQEEVVRTPAGLLARYCRFTVPGAGRDYRGSVLVHDLGVGSSAPSPRSDAVPRRPVGVPPHARGAAPIPLHRELSRSTAPRRSASTGPGPGPTRPTATDALFREPHDRPPAGSPCGHQERRVPPASLARVRRRKIADFGRPQARKEVAVTRALLQAVEEIRAIIEEHAEGAEANRRLSDAVYDAMDRAGLFAMLAPKAYGGLELHPVEAMRVWEAVARIDTAAAWNLVMNQAISAYAAWLPAEGARELFRDGPPTTAGALHPPAAATRVDGGWRLTGRVPFRERVPRRPLARHVGG